MLVYKKFNFRTIIIIINILLRIKAVLLARLNKRLIMKQYDTNKKINFYERNYNIKRNLLKVYCGTLILGIIFIAVKGFI